MASGLHAPSSSPLYTLSTELTENDETIVWVQEYCASDTDAWRYLASVWHSLLLIAASVLAFTTRKIKTDFNENQSLTLMIYSHAIFVLLRILTFSLEFGEGGETDAVLYRSMIFSCDTLSTIIIYFLSKFLFKKNNSGVVDLRTSQISQVVGSNDLSGGSSQKKTSKTSGQRKQESAVVPSIMECVHEDSSSDGESGGDSDDEEKRRKPIAWKAASGALSPTIKTAGNSTDNEDDALQNRLSNYMSQSTAGLRCRHCGKTVADDLDSSQMS